MDSEVTHCQRSGHAISQSKPHTAYPSQGAKKATAPMLRPCQAQNQNLICLNQKLIISDRLNNTCFQKMNQDFSQ